MRGKVAKKIRREAREHARPVVAQLRLDTLNAIAEMNRAKAHYEALAAALPNAATEAVVTP